MRSFPAALALAAASIAHGQDGLVIGGFDLDRGGILSITDGDLMLDLREAIERSFAGVELVSAPALTPEFLSTVDVVFLSSVHTTSTGIIPLSPDEQDALLGFVSAGGGAFILTDGNGEQSVQIANESLLSVFDVHSTGSLGSLGVEPVDHPIWDGPYGEPGGFALLCTATFDDLGPFAASLGAGVDGKVGLAVIEREAIGPDGGAVVLTADTSAFFDLFISPDSETFALNSISYAWKVCPADLNHDGELTILDFLHFQISFLKGEPSADCNEDGLLNVLDFVCFQALFKLGCG